MERVFAWLFYNIHYPYIETENKVELQVLIKLQNKSKNVILILLDGTVEQLTTYGDRHKRGFIIFFFVKPVIEWEQALQCLICFFLSIM